MQNREFTRGIDEHPSLRLQVATAYFALGAVMIVGSSLYHIISVSAAAASSGGAAQGSGWTLILALLTGLCWLSTAWCLHQRRRRGVWFAAVALLATASAPLSGRDLRTWDVGFLLGALLLFISVWRELED